MAKIYPIHKGGTKCDPANYRPLSILPAICKIFEEKKNINKHLMVFSNKYKLIHANQSGFCQKHSCQTALVKLIDKWLTCIYKGDIIGTVYLSIYFCFSRLQKAFDLVDQSILIEKLSLYKCKNNTLDLLSSYFHARKQVIENGKGTSKPALIK